MRRARGGLVANDPGEVVRLTLHHELDLGLLLACHQDAPVLELHEELVHLPLARVLGRLKDLGELAADGGARNLALRERELHQPHHHAPRVLLGGLGDGSRVLGRGEGRLEGVDGEGVVADVDALGVARDGCHLLQLGSRLAAQVVNGHNPRLGCRAVLLGRGKVGRGHGGVARDVDGGAHDGGHLGGSRAARHVRDRHGARGRHLEEVLHLVADADDVHLGADVGEVVEDGFLARPHVLGVAGVVVLVDVDHARLAILVHAHLEVVDVALVVLAIRDDDELLLAKVGVLNFLLDHADEVGAAIGLGNGWDGLKAAERLAHGEHQLEFVLLVIHRTGAVDDEPLALGVELVRGRGVGRGQVSAVVERQDRVDLHDRRHSSCVAERGTRVTNPVIRFAKVISCWEISYKFFLAHTHTHTHTPTMTSATRERGNGNSHCQMRTRA